MQLASLTMDSDHTANRTQATEKKNQYLSTLDGAMLAELPALECVLVMVNWVEKVPSIEQLLEQQNHQLGPEGNATDTSRTDVRKLDKIAGQLEL